MAAPTLVFSFRFMRPTRLASSGKGPRLQGSLGSLCFCFSVATNPCILLVLCLLQPLLHFLLQPLLGLLHPSIPPGLVLAPVGFYLPPIQSHSSQLQRSHL